MGSLCSITDMWNLNGIAGLRYIIDTVIVVTILSKKNPITLQSVICLPNMQPRCRIFNWSTLICHLAQKMQSSCGRKDVYNCFTQKGIYYIYMFCTEKIKDSPPPSTKLDFPGHLLCGCSLPKLRLQPSYISEHSTLSSLLQNWLGLFVGKVEPRLVVECKVWIPVLPK